MLSPRAVFTFDGGNATVAKFADGYRIFDAAGKRIGGSFKTIPSAVLYYHASYKVAIGQAQTIEERR